MTARADGVLDVIIGHDDGVALVNGNGGGEQVVLGGLEDVDD